MYGFIYIYIYIYIYMCIYIYVYVWTHMYIVPALGGSRGVGGCVCGPRQLLWPAGAPHYYIYYIIYIHIYIYIYIYIYVYMHVYIYKKDVCIYVLVKQLHLAARVARVVQVVQPDAALCTRMGSLSGDAYCKNSLCIVIIYKKIRLYI